MRGFHTKIALASFTNIGEGMLMYSLIIGFESCYSVLRSA